MPSKGYKRKLSSGKTVVKKYKGRPGRRVWMNKMLSGLRDQRAIGQVKEATRAFTATYGIAYPLVYIAQGTGQNQRIGQQVHLKTLSLHGAFQLPLEVVDNYTVIDRQGAGRIIIFADKSHTSSAPSWADVLEDVTSPLAAMMSHINPVNKDRFVFLHDSYVDLSRAATSNNDSGTPYLTPRVSPFKVRKNLNTTVGFNGADEDDYDSGQIYYMFLASNASNAALTNLTCYFRAKSRYND